MLALLGLVEVLVEVGIVIDGASSMSAEIRY